MKTASVNVAHINAKVKLLPTQPAAYAWRFPGKWIASEVSLTAADAVIKVTENIQCSNKPPCGVGEFMIIPLASVSGVEFDFHKRDHGITLLIPMTCFTSKRFSNVDRQCRRTETHHVHMYMLRIAGFRWRKLR